MAENHRQPATELLPYLDTFARAAELCNFTAAGRELGLTQAAVSQRIQTLEKTLQVSLFRRQAGQVLLTDAGRALYGYADQILSIHQHARQELTGQKAVIAGNLVLAASTVPGEYLLPLLLADFRKRYPKIRPTIRIGDSMEVIDQLEHGKVQVGLVGRKTEDRDLAFRQIATDRMVLVAPANHAWRKRRSVGLKQLAAQPLILREPGSGLRHCFEKSLDKAGQSLADMHVVLELGSNETVKGAVLRGLGVAVLSIYAVRKEIDAGEMITIRVRDLQCDRAIYVVHDQRRALAPAARAFLAYLETHPLR